MTDTTMRRRASTDRSELSALHRRLLVAGILAAHVAGIWSLLQLDTVRDALQQVTPIFVSQIAPAAPPPVPKTNAQEPRLPSKLQPPPAPAPLIAAPPTRTPAVEALVETAQPSTPAVSTTLSATAATAVTAAVAAVAAPSAAIESMPPPPTPRLLPDSAVQFMQLPEVVYPRLSQRNAESGLVIVRAYIGAAGGAPHSAHIEKSSGHARLDQAALAAVRNARFKPYAEKGQPVEGWALVPIRFELEK